MTVIRPNSVSGITSITAQANEINFFRSNGTLAGLQLNGVNFNTTTGVSTFNNLDVGGVLTYQDVTNVDSVGIITARSTIDAQGSINLADSIIHTGDTDTKIVFTDNQIDLQTGGFSRIYANNFAVYIRSGLPLGFLASSGPSSSIKSGGTNNQDLLFTTGTGNPTRMQIASSGNIGIGTNNPSNPLHITGADPQIKIQDSANGNNAQIFLDGPNSNLNFDWVSGANRKINFINSGSGGISVGIGTATPAHKLDVIDGIINVGAAVTTNDSRIQFTREDTGIFSWIGIPNWNPNALYIYGPKDSNPYNEAAAVYESSTWNFMAGGGERLRIKSDGIIETGTAIGASGADGDQRLRVGREGNCNIAVRATASTTATTGLDFGDSGDDRAGRIQYMHNGDYMSFHTNGAGSGASNERLRIDSSGNVNIGPSAAPRKRLDITGPDGRSGASSGNSDTALLIDNDGTNGAIIEMMADNNAYGRIFFTDTDASNRGQIVYEHANDAFQFSTAGTERLRIKSNGHVGIGENNPASTLVVRKDNQGGRGGELSIVNYAALPAGGVGNEAAINFGLENSTYNADAGNAQIKCLTTAANAATDIVISNWSGTSFEERLRIKANGDVDITSGVLARNPADNFTLNGATTPHYGFQLNANSSVPIAFAGYYGIVLATEGAERFRIARTGAISSAVTRQAVSYTALQTPTYWTLSATGTSNQTIDVSSVFGVPDNAKAILVQGWYHVSGYGQGNANQADHASSHFSEYLPSGGNPWSFTTSTTTTWGQYVMDHDGDASGSPLHYGMWGGVGVVNVNPNGNIYGRCFWGYSGGTHYNQLWCFGYYT